MIRLRFLLPVAAVAAVALTSLVPGPNANERLPRAATVNETGYACPAGAGTIAAGQLVAGQSAEVRVLGSAAAPKNFDRPDRWRTTGADDAVLVRQLGAGSGAVGFSVSQGKAAAGGGLSIEACPTVSDESWFVGLGSGGKHDSSLIFTNTADVPAVADVSLWGEEGPIDAVDAADIVVEPYSTRIVPLTDLAAGDSELAVRVQRRRGSLAVAASDRSTGVFKGFETTLGTAAPSEHQWIGGLAGASTRTLLLANPGAQTARAQVSVLGAEGEFVAAGLDDVKISAGSVRTVDLPRSLADAVSLSVTSDQAVFAGVRLTLSSQDYAYAMSQSPVSGPAIVPLDLADNVTAPQLILTAASSESRVNLKAYDSRMKLVSEGGLEVPSLSTVSLDLASNKIINVSDAAYLVIEGRDLIGSSIYRSGKKIAALQIRPAPLTEMSPDVRLKY